MLIPNHFVYGIENFESGQSYFFVFAKRKKERKDAEMQKRECHKAAPSSVHYRLYDCAWLPAVGSSFLGGFHLPAGQFFIAHGGVPDKGGDDGGGLFEVVGHQVVVVVHVGVVRAAPVGHAILDELEAGDAHGVKGQVVGAAGVLEGEGGGVEVFEIAQPFTEDGAHGLVALEVNTADAAGAVVEVVIGRDLLLFRLYVLQVAEVVGFGQVFFDVATGAVEALLLTGPKGQAEGAAGFLAGLFNGF